MKDSMCVAILLSMLALPMASCGKSDASSVIIEAGTVKRVNGCHINLDFIQLHPKASGPIGYFRFVCNVEESALNTKEWWGTQTQPLTFPMSAGDCTRLKKTFYCVENIDTSDGTVTLKATYEQKHWDGALLQRVK